jgi:hypothetical protein
VSFKQSFIDRYGPGEYIPVEPGGIGFPDPSKVSKQVYGGIYTEE